MSNTVSLRLALDGGEAVAADISKVNARLDALGKAATESSAGADRLSSAIGRVAHYGMAGGGLYALYNTITSVKDALFEASVASQRLSTQLNFATGGNAAKEMAFVSGVVNRLGLDLNSTAQAYAGFASAARGTAMEGKATRDVFEAIANANAVMGLTADQSKGSLLAIQQMMSKGVVNAEEFRGQLGERMPIALQAGAKALDLTTAEFSKLMESGQLVSQDFLPKFAVAINEMLGDSTTNAANRLDAATTRMGNAWEKLKRTVGDAGVSQGVANEAAGMANYVNQLSDAMENAKKSGSGLAGVLLTGLGTALARMPFDAAAGASNLLNGTINALTGNVFNLGTNLNLLPQMFQSNAQKAALLGSQLLAAQADLVSLQGKLAQVPDNIYLKSETYQAYLLVQQLTAAKKAQEALASGGAGRGSINPQTVEQMGAAQNKLNDAMEKYATKSEKADKAVEELRKAHGALFTSEMEQKVRASFETQKKGAKEAVTEYEKLAKKLEGDVAKGAAAAEAEQMGYNKAQTEFIELANSDAWSKLSEGERISAAAVYATKIAQEQAADATKERAKAEEALNQAIATSIKGMTDSYESVLKEARAEEERVAKLGLTTEQLGLLRLAEIDLMITQAERAAQTPELATAELSAIELKITAYKRLRAATGAATEKQAGIDTAKKVSEEWQHGWEETDRIAREAFTGWAENGTSMAETIGKSLKKAMLSAIYEATIKPIAFSIYSNMTGAPAGANALSQAGSAAGIFNAGSTLGFVGAGTSAFSAGASLQAAGMGTEAFAAGVEMMTSATGASSFMAGAGQALGAIGPVGWAALAAIAVLSLQDHGTPTQNTGNASASFDAAGNRTAYQTYFGGSSANTDAMIGNMQLAYLAGAKSLGINAAATNFSYGSNTGKDSQNPMFALSGGSGASSYSLGETAITDAAVSLAASRAVFAALKGSDLPGYLSQLFNSLTVDTMTQDQITNTLNFASSLKQVREALLETREPLQILKDNVATGFATLATSADTFKTDFVAAIDAGVSPATLSAWQALATTMDQLTAATEAANVALATSKSAVLGASEKVSSVLRAIGNDVKAFADAATTAHDNLVGARLNISEALWSAQDRVIELQRQAADGLRTFAASIDDFLSTINPATSSSASLTMLKAQLSTTAVLAAGGDTGAQGQLISQAQAVLKAAEANSTDRVQYARSEAFVRSTLATVKKAVDPTPIVDAVAVAIVDPMATAKAELKAAQDAVIAYSRLAQTTGAETDRSTRLVAGSVSDLATAYGVALVANTDAQANYAEALRVTTGLQLTMSGSFDALIKDLADLSTANSTFATSIATFVADSNTASLNIATSLGLTGTAATTLAGLLDAPGTAATTLATLLGDPKGNMDALVTSLGLTGTAATGFKTALTGFNPGTLIGDQLGLAGTALTNFATLVNSIRITVPTVTPPVTAPPVTTTGGALAGVQTVSMPDAVTALVTAQTSAPDASAAQIVNAANVNLGVSATDMALVGTAAGDTDIVAAANYANTDIVANGGLIGSAQAITVATLQSVLTELSPSYTAAQLITAAQTNWGVSEEDVRAVGKSLSLPGYRVGTNAVPFDMTARIHAGEEITPRPFVDMQRAARDETNDLLRRLVASNAELKAEVTALKKSNEAGAKAAEKTADTLVTVTRGGRAIQTEAFV